MKAAGPKRRIRRPNVSQEGQFTSGLIHYEHAVPARWTTGVSVVDTINQLVYVCRYHRFVAIFASDEADRDRIFRAFGDNAMPGLAELRAVDPDLMNAAFIAGNPTTVWLWGVHRPVVRKANTKVFSGADVRECLNPLDDQSYCLMRRALVEDGVGRPQHDRRVPDRVARLGGAEHHSGPVPAGREGDPVAARCRCPIRSRCYRRA